MYSNETIIRVRYAETDQMGFVYYGNYLTYYEVARVESLRKLGIRYKEIEESGVIMPVTENYSKYIQPARYDENLRVVTTIKEWPDYKIKFLYNIYNEQNKLIHKGHTLLVFLDANTLKPCNPPLIFNEKMKGFFNVE